MSAAEAPVVAEVFGELRREGLEFHPEGDFFAQRWGELDPLAAIGFVEQHGDFGRADQSVVSVFTGWGMTRPEAALQWFLDHPESPMRERALKGLAQGWARDDAESATDMVVGVLEGADQAEAAEMVAWQVLYSRGLDRAADWYDQLPDSPELTEARRRAFWVLKERQLMSGSEASREWVAERSAALGGQ